MSRTRVSNELSYEFFCILSSNIGEEEQENIIKKVESLINENGVLESIDRWGKRKFAYPVKKETEGTYVLFNFSSKTDFPAEIDRVSRITDGVLRTLIVKKEDSDNNQEVK